LRELRASAHARLRRWHRLDVGIGSAVTSIGTLGKRVDRSDGSARLAVNAPDDGQAVGDVHDDLHTLADENVIRFEREGRRVRPIVPHDHVEIEVSLPRINDPV